MRLLTRALVFAMPLSTFFPLGACVGLVGPAHQNFLNIYQLQVGSDIANPNSMRNRYPQRRVSMKVLANGNTEEEFQAGRELRCRVFFEIDNKAKKIMAWRYEGTEQDCGIAP